MKFSLRLKRSRYKIFMHGAMGRIQDFVLLGVRILIQSLTVKSKNTLVCTGLGSIYLLFFIYLFIAFYWAGFTIAQRERAQEDFNVPYEGAPPHPSPICIRKTATAPGTPYSFRIVRGFFYVPQNYQHSRNCETGPPAYRPYPRRLESLTICR